MADEQPQVEHIGESKQKLQGQFGTGWLYIREGKKWILDIRIIKAGCLISFVLVAALLIVNDGRKSQPSQSEAKGSMPTPDGGSGGAPVDVPPAAQGGASQADSGPRGRGKSVIYSGPEVVARPKNFKFPPGSMVKAKLASGASNGPVRAELTEDLAVNGDVVLPEGAIVLGQGSSNSERLQIRFTTVVFKSGESQAINAVALDEGDKIAGLKGSKVGYYAARLSAGIGLNFVGGVSTGLQDTEVQQGVAFKKPTMKNALLNGAATASLQEAGELLNEARSEQPVIEVEAGKGLLLLFGSEQ